VIALDPTEMAGAVISETITTEVSASATDATQTNPPWGLDRIDQRALPLNARYNYVSTGAGVRVYIIDTGIRITHSEFQGRASYGIDTIDGSLPANDCNGHGTHVAGSVGGRTYGVAKGVQLIAVRVLDCAGSGSNSQVIAGVNWVTNQRRVNPTIPAVANMSLGGSTSPTLDAAVTNSIAAGVTFVIAAGNNNGGNACNISPARVAQALTVGATTATDARATYSNIGSCVDLFAPGSGITSAWWSSDTAINTLDGTSMATPHVAGIAALYLQSHASALPAEVANALNNNATANLVSNPGANSPNRLLYSGVIPFNKLSPANGAAQVPTSLTLAWEPAAGAVQFGYCFDAVINNTCGQGVDNFTRFNGTNVTLALQPNTVYEWQVRAYTANGEWAAGNGYGSWWTFTTAAGVAPGAFGKLNPANSSTNVSPAVTLSWQPATNAVQYGYCIDTTLDSLCDRGVDNFIRVNGTSTALALETGKTYEWQARAYAANGAWTPGNGSGQWWRFTTSSAPGPFNKTYPGNNATNVPTSINLTWNLSAGALYYLVCIDTTADSSCNGLGDNTNFIRVNGTSYAVNLARNTAYSWQVRAVGANGAWTPGNGDGQWWGFRTRP